MLKIKVTLLCVLALCMCSGIAASTASAGGPFWHVAGSKLGQGVSKSVKLQNKGTLALSTKVGTIEAVLECRTSVSENATVEGQGNAQGQGTGRVTYTQCSEFKPDKECRVVEPVITNQLKAHLVYLPNNKQQKYGVLIEPTTGKKFVELDFKGLGCGVVLGFQSISGSVVGEIVPTEKEGQEGLLNFPSEAISEVIHEQRVVKPRLLFAGTEQAVFSGAYGARLATNELWGAFGT